MAWFSWIWEHLGARIQFAELPGDPDRICIPEFRGEWSTFAKSCLSTGMATKRHFIEKYMFDIIYSSLCIEKKVKIDLSIRKIYIMSKRCEIFVESIINIDISGFSNKKYLRVIFRHFNIVFLSPHIYTNYNHYYVEYSNVGDDLHVQGRLLLCTLATMNSRLSECPVLFPRISILLHVITTKSRIPPNLSIL